MKHISRVLVSIFLLAAMVMIVSPVFGQDEAADNMQILLEKIRADKKLFVSEVMQLTGTEAKAFWPVYDQYQGELFLIRARTAKMIKDYADAYGKMTNDKARSLMDEFMTIETLGLALRQSYLEEFRKVLPDVKVVRYYQIENKIQAVLLYEIAKKVPFAKEAK